MPQTERTVEADNNAISGIFGEFDSNIAKIEKEMSVKIVNRNEGIKIVGEQEAGVTSHKASQVVGCPHVLPAPSKSGQCNHYNDDDQLSGGQIRHIQLVAENTECQRRQRGLMDRIRPVERGK